MAVHLSKSIRLKLIILIATSFFAVEVAVGFYAHSLALIADAFHYLNDLVGFIIALIALELTESTQPPPRCLSYGWQRAQILGAFFNGVFLFALGISAVLQSIQKFIFMHNDVTHPKAVLVVGSVGLALNICSVIFMHEHGTDDDDDFGELPDEEIYENNSLQMVSATKPRYELGSLGVMLHLIGDALNNIGVIASALVIWLAKYEGRYYADPAVSMAIALMILATSTPLVLSSGRILIQSLPTNVNLDDIETHLKAIPGILAIDELCIWRLNQHTNIGSVHVLLERQNDISKFSTAMKAVRQRLHGFGVHSVTIQMEVSQTTSDVAQGGQAVGEARIQNAKESIVLQEEKYVG